MTAAGRCSAEWRIHGTVCHFCWFINFWFTVYEKCVKGLAQKSYCGPDAESVINKWMQKGQLSLVNHSLNLFPACLISISRWSTTAGELNGCPLRPFACRLFPRPLFSQAFSLTPRLSLRDWSRVSQCQWRPPWQQITLTSFLPLLLIAPRPGTVQTPRVGRDWGVCVSVWVLKKFGSIYHCLSPVTEKHGGCAVPVLLVHSY